MLGVASSRSDDVDVVAELRSRLEAAGLVATASSMTQSQDEAVAAAVASETAKYETTIAELRTKNDSLTTKLRAVYKANQDAKQRHARDVARLHKTVVELQQKQKEQEANDAEQSGQRSNAATDVSATKIF